MRPTFAAVASSPAHHLLDQLGRSGSLPRSAMGAGEGDAISDDLETHLKKTARALRQFVRAGLELIPLAKASKVPRDRGWRAISYDLAEIGRWMKAGGNAGIRLRDVDLVIDIDPRNFTPGDDPVKRLCADLAVDIENAPTVLSGGEGGGRHLYFRKPARLRIVSRLDGYPGIDFLSAGKLVVAPCSRHPKSGRIYTVDDITPPISKVKGAPKALLSLLARAPREDSLDGFERGGNYTPDQLGQLLAALEPKEYGAGRYDAWLRLAAACHDATGGAGLPEFLAWCAGDPTYADEASQERVEKHWQSFKAGRPGGATYRTLLRAVVDVGRADLVAVLDVEEDALDEDLVVYELETETDNG